MSADDAQREGIKLIGDWSKWFATLSTGAIAGIVAVIARRDVPTLSIVARFILFLSALLFVFSTVMAVLILLALPEAIQDMNPGDKIWDRGGEVALKGWTIKGKVVWEGRTIQYTLWRTAYFQLFLFAAAALVAAIGGLLA